MRNPCPTCYGTGLRVTLGGAQIFCNACFGTGIRGARPNSYNSPCVFCRKYVQSYKGILVKGKAAHADCAKKRYL